MPSKDDILDSYLLLPCRRDSKGESSKERIIEGWFTVETRPLRIDTMLFVGDENQFKTQLKRKERIDLTLESEFKGVSGLTLSLERPDGSSLVVIWMPKFDWSIIDMETLSHECLHASIMVMRLSGVRSKIFTANTDDEVDDEWLCYRQATMLTGFIKKMMERQNRTVNKKTSTKRKSK